MHKHCISIDVYHGFLAESYIYILYGQLSPIFFFFNFLTQDITQKLGMLQEEYDNATAMTRTLEANLTGKKSHIWRYLIKIEYGKPYKKSVKYQVLALTLNYLSTNCLLT